jgi:tryptophan 7-halogenase
LLTNIEGEPLKEPNYLRFIPGARKKVWLKNVLAIGLSSGFLEPLESTSIHLIQRGLSKLISWFPEKKFQQKNIDEYNRLHAHEVERVRDFVILHYKTTQRCDSEFWNYCRNMEIPPELKNKIDTFAQTGRLIELPSDSFQEASWLTVMVGQGIKPAAYDPIAELNDAGQLKTIFENMRGMIRNAAHTMPMHADYIAENCAALKDIKI